VDPARLYQPLPPPQNLHSAHLFDHLCRQRDLYLHPSAPVLFRRHLYHREPQHGPGQPVGQPDRPRARRARPSARILRSPAREPGLSGAALSGAARRQPHHGLSADRRGYPPPAEKSHQADDGQNRDGQARRHRRFPAAGLAHGHPRHRCLQVALPPDRDGGDPQHRRLCRQAERDLARQARRVGAFPAGVQRNFQLCRLR